MAGWGFTPLYFEYDSYLGIDVAATSLLERLTPLSESLKQTGLVLIGHSMGGLVARQCARLMAFSSFNEVLLGICALGTPHGGTLKSQQMISRIADWSDWLTGINPYLRLPTCRSAQQLMGTDEEHFLETLNSLDRDQPLPIPILTVSGGLKHLEFGSGTVRNQLANQFLQSHLRTPNDGLVAEEDADLRVVLRRYDLPITHINNYADFQRTNHTYLVRNQEVAQRVIGWCLDRFAQRVDPQIP